MRGRFFGVCSWAIGFDKLGADHSLVSLFANLATGVAVGAKVSNIDVFDLALGSWQCRRNLRQKLVELSLAF